MQDFKKSQLYAVIIMAIIALIIGINVIINQNINISNNISIIVSTIISYIFFTTASISFFLRKSFNHSKTYLLGIVFSTVALSITLSSIWIEIPSQKNFLLPIGYLFGSYSFLFINYGITNIAESYNSFSELSKISIKIICSLLFIFVTVYVIAPNMYSFEIRLGMILFLLLMFFDFIMALLHYYAKKLPEKCYTLYLQKTEKENVYTDKYGRLFEVKSL